MRLLNSKVVNISEDLVEREGNIRPLSDVVLLQRRRRVVGCYNHPMNLPRHRPTPWYHIFICGFVIFLIQMACKEGGGFSSAVLSEFGVAFDKNKHEIVVPRAAPTFVLPKVGASFAASMNAGKEKVTTLPEMQSLFASLHSFLRDQNDDSAARTLQNLLAKAESKSDDSGGSATSTSSPSTPSPRVIVCRRRAIKNLWSFEPYMSQYDIDICNTKIRATRARLSSSSFSSSASPSSSSSSSSSSTFAGAPAAGAGGDVNDVVQVLSSLTLDKAGSSSSSSSSLSSVSSSSTANAAAAAAAAPATLAPLFLDVIREPTSITADAVSAGAAFEQMCIWDKEDTFPEAGFFTCAIVKVGPYILVTVGEVDAKDEKGLPVL